MSTDTTGTVSEDFQSLRVAAMAYEADGILSVQLRRTDGMPLPSWTPGSHIDVMFPNKCLRQYSLSGDRDNDLTWRLGVLHEQAGRGGSDYVHGRLRPGDEVMVRGPRNNFELRDAEKYLFIAGGIGITPILPMIATAEHNARPWRLVYGGRTLSSMAFIDELADWTDQVQLVPEDRYGRIPLGQIISDADPGTHVYCCGPPALIVAVEELCAEWEPGRLHVERFVSAAISTTSPPAEETGFRVVLSESGESVDVRNGQSILEALEATGRSPLNSCREGICGTCETRVLSGDIDHRDSLLSDEEHAAGETMLICVSRCSGDKLVLELP